MIRQTRSVTRMGLRARGGFSLVEAAVATVVVGLALVALMGTLASGTRSNDGAQKITTASFLAQEIREWTLRLPFSDPDPGDAGKPPGPDGTNPQIFVDDLDDLMGVTYGPPRDGRGKPIYDLSDWSQTIYMSWRDPASLTTSVEPGGSDIVHVQAVIGYQGKHVLTARWLATRGG